MEFDVTIEIPKGGGNKYEVFALGLSAASLRVFSN